MIRRGKADGWLRLPLTTLVGNDGGSAHPTFASTFGIDASHVKCATVPSKGAALVANSEIDNCHQTPVLTVPRDVILSRENAILLSKTDIHLRQVLDAASKAGLSSGRHVLILLLLVQATHSCPTIPERVSISGPFSNYIKFLPLEHLPTFWGEEEIALLAGTTLKPAITAKLTSLYREYQLLQECTRPIPWCSKYWWDDIDGLLQFDDWKQVDAMYRSRALELPGLGDCMVPCIDMANHASGAATLARYEANQDLEAMLYVEEGKKLHANEEITITYGEDKGACEMLFSYGFIERGFSDARTMFLDLDVPADDPLAQAKRHVATCAPGVRLSSHSGTFNWHSDFVWLAVVNEEDGLDFEVIQMVDGSRELSTTLNGIVVHDCSEIESALKSQSLWPVYRLRAVSLIGGRIEEQLHTLDTSHQDLEDTPASVRADDHEAKDSHLTLIHELRVLEQNLLELAAKHLEIERNSLLEDVVVQAYLQHMNTTTSDSVDNFA